MDSYLQINRKYTNWIKSVTIDRVVLFFFLLINVGLYYKQYLFLITPTYILLFAGFANKLIVKHKLIHGNYLIICGSFALYAFFSTLWADVPELAISNSLFLLKYVFISIMLISILDTRKNIEFAMWMLALSGLIYALIFLASWDVSALGSARANSAMSDSDEALPNLNVVGLITANSFVCFLFFYFNNKSKLAILLASIAFIVIFFLGSRKSILFAVLGIFMIFIKLKGASKFGLTILLSLFLQLVIFFVPADYFSFIFDRFGELKFLSSVSNLDYSDQLRVDFANYSINYINSKPLFGHGYFNFSSLFYRDNGIAAYSHNNFLEIAVGLGSVGIFIYYSLYVVIARQLTSSKREDLTYLFLILLMLNVLNHFFIVVSNERFTWMLLPILYAGSKLSGNKMSTSKIPEP